MKNLSRSRLRDFARMICVTNSGEIKKEEMKLNKKTMKHLQPENFTWHLIEFIPSCDSPSLILDYNGGKPHHAFGEENYAILP
jgi:hypothetical protein